MRRTVLLIDDRLEDFARCQAALAECVAPRYLVTNAVSGDEALSVMQRTRPDCVLVDYSAPGNGLAAFIKRLRAEHRSVPAIVLAGPEVQPRQLAELRSEGLPFLPKSAISAGTLPDAIERVIEEAEKIERSESPASAPSHTVLIIDDNPDDREAFRRALRKTDESYCYLEAADSLSGVEMVEKHRPDCILLDYSLPGLNGIATLQRIHTLDSSVPVIMLTGQGNEAIAVQAMKEGAQNYLVKTALTPNLLHRAILAAIEHASLAREISEQRRQIYAQKLALAETDRLKTAILDSAASIIVATDRDGRILTFNSAAEKTLGYAAADVIGKQTPLLWFDEGEIARRAADLAISHGLRSACGFEVLSLLPEKTGREAREWTFRRKDGTQFPARLSMTPLRDSEGNITGFLGLAEDITQARQQQLALKTSEETFRCAVENAPNGMALIDPQNRLIKVNPALCDLLGYTEAELMGMPLAKIPHPDDAGIDLESIRQLYRGLLPSYRVEKRLLHRSGRVVHVLLAMSVMRNNDGRAKCCVVQVQDITERKEMERLKNEFISVVSHELRTPLTSIRGSLGLLAGKIVEGVPEMAQTLIDRAYKNCERLILLINDILDIDKIASGTMRFDMRAERLAPLLEEAAEGIRGYADAHAIRVSLEPLEGEPVVKADRERLIQVLNNLLSNAVKFSPKHGEVLLSAAPTAGGGVRIGVRDHGPGIPKECEDRLFNKFFQVDASSTREKGGTGLGLHISKQIVEQMGGAIGFDSTPAEGTTVWVELPSPAAGKHSAQLDAGEPAEKGIADPGRRVLICEDEDRVAWLIQKMLTREGFAADVVYSIEEARSMLKTGNYAAMTLDLALPEGNGMEFARELHADQEMAHLPIVIVSGTERESWLQLDERAGIVDWIVKPIDAARLIASVEKAAAGNAKVNGLAAR